MCPYKSLKKLLKSLVCFLEYHKVFTIKKIAFQICYCISNLVYYYNTIIFDLIQISDYNIRKRLKKKLSCT